MAFGEPQAFHGGGETLRCASEHLRHEGAPAGALGLSVPLPRDENTSAVWFPRQEGDAAACDTLSLQQPETELPSLRLQQQQLSFKNASCQHLAQGSGLKQLINALPKP